MKSASKKGGAVVDLLAQVPEDHLLEARLWESRLLPVVALKRGITSALEKVASEFGVPVKTIQKRFYAYKRSGLLGLIDRRKAGPAFWNSEEKLGLSADDRELLRTYCENQQRSTDAAIRRLRADWRAGRVVTSTPVDAATGFPRGWHPRNLQRYAPSRFELKAARIGRGAAASERPLVYLTRANLYVGQFYLFDDMWHDHMVNDLDTRSAGRPLEFHCMDLSSAYKNAWGLRVRREVDGVNRSLTGEDFRFLLASMLSSDGYHPQGTTLVVEHGTAAISEHVERLLHDATGGLINVSRSGMQGSPAHAGQYAGRPKGNFRFKAALESLGNLIHNEMAFLPGQTGKDREHRPEQLHGLLKRNDALLCALAQLPLERAQWLQWDLCTIQQFRLICEEIYARINARTDHDLEGWDARFIHDARTGRMRRMSPAEVWRPGRKALERVSPATAALIVGSRGGVERMTGKGRIELRDSTVSADVLRFDAHTLADRQKFLTVLNPIAPQVLFCFDSKGRYVATLPRLQSVCRGDSEAIQKACGAAAKIESAMLAPLRRRHQVEIREKADKHLQTALRVRNAPLEFTAKRESDVPLLRARNVDPSTFAAALSIGTEETERPAKTFSPEVISDLFRA